MIRGIIFDCYGVLVSGSLDYTHLLPSTNRRPEVRNAEMLRYVLRLKKDYRTALLSNIGRGTIERLFTPQELKEFFDTVVLSSEVGMTKPNAEIYRYAAAQLGLAPEECIMIDDIPFNVEGAEMTGMRGVIFESVEGCKRAVTELMEENYA